VHGSNFQNTFLFVRAAAAARTPLAFKAELFHHAAIDGVTDRPLRAVFCLQILWEKLKSIKMEI
jgi:hypothetical protein